MTAGFESEVRNINYKNFGSLSSVKKRSKDVFFTIFRGNNGRRKIMLKFFCCRLINRVFLDAISCKLHRYV